MKHQASKILATIFFLLLGISVSITQAQSPQDTLNQYIFDLQKNPSDTALREKIIKLAREMNPPPAIPEEARRHYVKASTLFDDAKQPSDSADAAEEFRQALLVAPWWGEAYMKMGLALETAQRYDDAIASLKLFMATKPQDEVLRKTQDEIYKIEAKAERAAKDKEQAAKEAQANAAREAQAAAEEKAVKERESSRLRQFCGTWGRVSNPRTEPGRGLVIGLNGAGELAVESIHGNTDRRNATISIDGRRIKIHSPGVMSDGWTYDWDFVLSNDGSTLSGRFSSSVPEGLHSEHDEVWRRE
jgi:hypothetical protein